MALATILCRICSLSPPLKVNLLLIKFTVLGDEDRCLASVNFPTALHQCALTLHVPGVKGYLIILSPFSCGPFC